MTTSGGVLDDPARSRAADALRPADDAAVGRLDRVTRTVTRLLATPAALLDLVSADAVEVLSCVGLDLRRMDRDSAPCSGVVAAGAALVVVDTRADRRWRDSPLVVAPPHVRAYVGVPLRGSQGHVVGALCALDLRPRRWTPSEVSVLVDLAGWAEAELGRAEVDRAREHAGSALERMKDELVGVLSHELRTPLTSLQGALGLLGGEALGPLTASGRQVTGIALASAERLARVVDQVCELDGLLRGQVVLRRGPEPLEPLVRAAVVAVQGSADRAGVDVRTAVGAGTVWLDGPRMTAVLEQLLSNAVRASGPGAAVELRAGVTDGTLLVEVEDSGCGIAADDLERVFSSFTRLDSSDSRRHAGTGTGLAFARAVVEAHGGRLDAVSAVGRGTTLRARLPQRSAAPARPGAAS